MSSRAVIYVGVAAGLLMGQRWGHGATATALTTAASEYEVKAGDTLWQIARAHGCNVDEVAAANKLRDNIIYPGQKLTMPACTSASPTSGSNITAAVATSAPSPSVEGGGQVHSVVAGDTLGAIAAMYSTSVEDIQAHNGLGGTVIFPGQKLRVVPGSRGSARIRAIIGQSVGRPQGGRLVNATRLGHDRTYYRRRLERTYGTNTTVWQVQRIARAIRRRFPKLHPLAVGDLSVKKGGKITLHESHQTGRDVDLGFYFMRKPKNYPKDFVDASNADIHFDANWMMLTMLAQTAEQASGVERIFMSHSLQRRLIKLARQRKVNEKLLRQLFQAATGEYSMTGIIRHEPNHTDHIHVRFKCPDGDPGCH